jgi:hypothetical protein
MNELLVETTVKCPYCGHEFRACIHSDDHPNAGERYEVNCPCHGGPFEFVVARSKDVEPPDDRDRLAWGEGPSPVFARRLQQVEKCSNSLPKAYLVRKQHLIKRLLAWLGLS